MTDAELVEQALQRWIDLVHARDAQALEAYVSEFFTPDARIDLGGGVPDSIDAIVRFGNEAFREWQATGAVFRYEIAEVVDSGTAVAVAIRSSGPFDGEQVEGGFTYLARVREGRITSLVVFATLGDALAAA